MSKKGWEAALESGLKMSGESGPEKELGWLMIAKYLPRCSDLEKRTMRSRMSSRFTNACQTSYSLASALFIRAALAAFPAFRNLYTAQLDGYLQELLREAQESSTAEGSHLEAATRELWASHATTDRLEKAAGELRTVVYEFGKAVEVSGLRERRGCLLLRLVADCVRHADKGSSIPGALLDTIGAAIEKTAWRADALRLLEAVVRAASWAIACNAKSLCQSLIRLPPSAELYGVLTAMEETLGASSHLHAHLAIVFNGLKHPLPAEYAEEAARLLETVIVRSGSLVDPAVLSCVCSAICAAALRYRTLPGTTRVYGRLVAALLAHGNDAVAVPVHIARSMISSMPPCEERSRLQMMADVVARPRTYAMGASLLLDETARVRKEAAMCRSVKREEEEAMNGVGEKMEESPSDSYLAAEAAHDKEMVQMRVMEGEEKKEGDPDEEEEMEEEEEEDDKKVKKEIHIQSRKEKKRAAKKRRSEEKAAASAVKKQKTAVGGSVQPKNQPSPKKEEQIKEQPKAVEKKVLVVPSTPLVPPQPIPADLQEVIDMAVLDFD